MQTLKLQWTELHIDDAIRQQYQARVETSTGHKLRELYKVYLETRKDPAIFKHAKSADFDTLQLAISNRGIVFEDVLRKIEDFLRQYIEFILLDACEFKPYHKKSYKYNPALRDLEHQINAVGLELLENIHGNARIYIILGMSPDIVREKMVSGCTTRSLCTTAMELELSGENVRMTADDMSIDAPSLQARSYLLYAVCHADSGNLTMWCPITGDWCRAEKYSTAHIMPSSFGAESVARIFGKSKESGRRIIFGPKNTIPMCQELWVLFDKFSVTVLPVEDNKYVFLVLDQAILGNTVSFGEANTVKLSQLHGRELSWRNLERPYPGCLVARWLFAIELRRYSVALSPDSRQNLPRLITFRSKFAFSRCHYDDFVPVTGEYLDPNFLRQWAKLAGLFSGHGKISSWLENLALKERLIHDMEAATLARRMRIRSLRLLIEASARRNVLAANEDG